jgi:DNA-binding SARP family transcriptional activator/pimeloyl-ACP methyl ester carboxylesterase
MGLLVHLLDPLSVETDGDLVDGARLGGDHCRLAFALLVAQRGRAVAREELADALWGEALPRTWGPALRNVMSRVRVFLADAGVDPTALASGGGGYQLRLPPGAVVDLEQLEEQLVASRVALRADDPARAGELAAMAVDVARRSFLPGVEGPWVDSVRLRVRGLHVQALQLAAQAGLRGDGAAAVAPAQELVGLEPFGEEGYRLLMRAQAAAGNRAAALLTYMRCRSVLGDELGVEPSAQTERTYLQILREVGDDEPAQPETRYVHVGSARVAYHVTGNGPIDLAVTGGTYTHVDQIWRDAVPSMFFAHFLAATRLVFFDPRGAGASDPLPADATAGWASRQQDLRAVLDAVGSDRAVILAALDGGPLALRFAAETPGRVSGLVLVNTTARWLEAGGYPQGLSTQVAQALIRRVREVWGTERFAAELYPSLRTDVGFLRWYARLQRTMVSPHTAADGLSRLQQIDARPLLHRIRVPTLVLHRRTHSAFPLAQGRYLAGHIAGATLVELPGGEGLFGSDSDTVADEIHRFLREECGPDAQGRKGVVAVRQRAANASSTAGGAQQRLPSR